MWWAERVSLVDVVYQCLLIEGQLVSFCQMVNGLMTSVSNVIVVGFLVHLIVCSSSHDFNNITLYHDNVS